MREVDKNVATSSHSLYYDAYIFSSDQLQRQQSLITQQQQQQQQQQVGDDAASDLPASFQRTIPTIRPSTSAKKKKVYCYISPKVLKTHD